MSYLFLTHKLRKYFCALATKIVLIFVATISLFFTQIHIKERKEKGTFLSLSTTGFKTQLHVSPPTNLHLNKFLHNPGYQNCCKSYPNLAKWLDFAFWWSCIGKGAGLFLYTYTYTYTYISKNKEVNTNLIKMYKSDADIGTET